MRANPLPKALGGERDIIEKMELIQRGLHSHRQEYYGEPLKFYSITLDRWFKELTKPSLKQKDSPDRLRRKAQLLLRENLYPFTPTPSRYLPLLQRYL